MARPKLDKKMETPLYENKGEVFLPTPNLVEVIIAHDGLEVGQKFIANEGTIAIMVNLGYWKICK